MWRSPAGGQRGGADEVELRDRRARSPGGLGASEGVSGGQEGVAEIRSSRSILPASGAFVARVAPLALATEPAVAEDAEAIARRGY